MTKDMEVRWGRLSWINNAILLLLLIWTGRGLESAGAPPGFTVASFNLENYTDQGNPSRPAKTAAARQKICEILQAMHADVLGLQEIGSTNALLELRGALKRSGLDYPYWEHVTGYDTNIYVAVLSRFPIVERRSHSQDGFLLNGRRFRVTRGIAEIDIQVSPKYQFTLLAAHLKSRRPSAVADESEMREQEALILREKIEARLKVNPSANLVVLGDFNDVKDSRTVRVIAGKGRGALVDTRPAERNGDADPAKAGRTNSRQITWTHFYAKEDTYSRVDYIFLSAGMAREWDPGKSYVAAVSNWGEASDHRPVLASFKGEEQ